MSRENDESFLTGFAKPVSVDGGSTGTTTMHVEVFPRFTVDGATQPTVIFDSGIGRGFNTLEL